MPWLLGLLVLVLVIWLLAEFFSTDGEERGTTQPEQVEQEATTESSAMATGGVITDAAVLLNAEDPRQLAGRAVELSSMNVTSVTGDSTFYVTSEGSDRRFLIALNEVIPSLPEGVEGRYDVTEGQVIDISGHVRALSNYEPDAWGISEQEAQPMMDDQIYIRAQSLTIVEDSPE